ncbi:Holliday junction resolvase RuvX [Candidatus Parcubacteria bacterium]|nr:Holliday junction resolvase RuvX [Candidatus Parcubacteria bacterium]
MKILAVDYGSASVGLAISDPGCSFAFPFRTIQAGSRIIRTLKEICDAEGVTKIIVGHPRTLTGGDGQQVTAAQRFAQRLRQAVSVAVEFEDERFTSALARRCLRESAAKGDGHSVAAACILESHLTHLHL